MQSFVESIIDKLAEYGAEVSELSVELAIEAFKEIRNYPASYDSERIEADLLANQSKISMAAVEIESRNGMENEVSRSENGVTLNFYDGIRAYRGVTGFAKMA